MCPWQMALNTLSVEELIGNILSAKNPEQILQVTPSASYSEAKAQYRKIALLIHPDKNASLQACTAFQKAADALQSLRERSNSRQPS